MNEFLAYVLQEVKNKRLGKADALLMVRQRFDADPAGLALALEGFVGRPDAHAPVAAPGAAAAAEDELTGKAVDFFRQMVSRDLKLPLHRVDAHARLERYGLDSIMIMRWTLKLEKAFGPLPKTLLFEHQTIAELAVYFVAGHRATLVSMFGEVATAREPSVADPVAPAASEPARPTATTAAATTTTTSSDIAIIGISVEVGSR